VEEEVQLPGYDLNPMRYFARASVYVLSSLWEGASNALLEAIACGCPVVATDCPTGVRELLEHGKIGPITPPNDARALAEAIAKRLDAPRRSDELKAHAAKFDVNESLSRYLQVIREAAALAEQS
jgi:glycosyltransferase involved in cell wall biosynthesis